MVELKNIRRYMNSTIVPISVELGMRRTHLLQRTEHPSAEDLRIFVLRGQQIAKWRKGTADSVLSGHPQAYGVLLGTTINIRSGYV